MSKDKIAEQMRLHGGVCARIRAFIAALLEDNLPFLTMSERVLATSLFQTADMLVAVTIGSLTINSSWLYHRYIWYT